MHVHSQYQNTNTVVSYKTSLFHNRKSIQVLFLFVEAVIGLSVCFCVALLALAAVIVMLWKLRTQAKNKDENQESTNQSKRTQNKGGPPRYVFTPGNGKQPVPSSEMQPAADEEVYEEVAEAPGTR